MKLETIKRNNKKKIIIGSMIVLSVVGCLTLTVTRAKYRSVQSLKLANGTIDYKSPDFKLAIKVSEDGTTYKNSNTIPEGNYTLNTEKSKCRIPTASLTGEDAPIAEGVTIEYIDGKVNVLGVTKKDTRCYVYFDKKQDPPLTIDDIILGLNAKKLTPNFAQVATADEGVYMTSDGMYGGTTYYWRGAATTNYVEFADYCWRIIRINGDKTIRLIYDGAVCHANGESTLDSIAIQAQVYNSTSDKSYYVGWTHGTGQRTLSGTASNAKAQTEKWFNNNISAAAMAKIDLNGKFCNDRSVGQPYSSWSGYVTSWSANGNAFAYSSVSRVMNGYNPSFNCDVGDVYNLKVGMVTSDEVQFAGAYWMSANNSFYLNNGQSYWTMTPYTWNGISASYVYALFQGNSIIGDNLWREYGIRPVINLKSDIEFQTGGTGTLNNPYIVQ